MIKDNLIMLRNMHGYSQEKLAEKIGISRQAYAKWESGATIPDIEKCSLLARVYSISVDDLISTNSIEGIGMIPPGPIGKNLWGVVTINSRGQIVIPKDVRDCFHLQEGTRLVVGSDEHGIALIPMDEFEKIVKKGREFMSIKKNGMDE